MPKRPDQHNLDHNEAGATDYKFRRKTEDSARRESPDELPANQPKTQTPGEAMEASRQASESGREKELERARAAHEENESTTDKKEGS